MFEITLFKKKELTMEMKFNKKTVVENQENLIKVNTYATNENKCNPKINGACRRYLIS